MLFEWLALFIKIYSLSCCCIYEFDCTHLFEYSFLISGTWQQLITFKKYLKILINVIRMASIIQQNLQS